MALRVSRLAAIATVIALAPFDGAKAASTVNVGVVNDFAGWNPYADSTAQMYMIWCQTYGCLGTFDANSGAYQPLLAESWETDKSDPRVWYFHLRHGLKRQHDGKELTADDVVHSIDRTKHDPHTAQANNVHPIASAAALDGYTVKIITNEPTAPLLDYLFDRLIITGKDLYDKYGAAADRKAPYGWGPYVVANLAIGQRMVLDKNPDWPGLKEDNPDRIIFSRIKEDEPRITALLNGEIDVAVAVPPHLAKQVEAAHGVRAVAVPSVEDMFLAMNPHFPPWNNKALRKAVAYAIDREAIIKSVFQGRAELLDGPIGPGQYAYSADVKPKYRYDPEKAKQLVRQAGFPDGLDVALFASTDRYVNDRESSQAIAAMLTKIGIRTKLNMLDYSIEWPNVRKGLVPFYYQGRGSVIDPSPMLEQYFETGITPRIGYSNARLDSILQAQRREFDSARRRALLLQAFNMIEEDLPAFFLWRINSLYGISNKIAFKPEADERIFGTDIMVKK